MSAIKENRETLKLYKKIDACRKEWIPTQDFNDYRDRFLPVEYSTPSNKKYSKSWAGVRYIRVEELNSFIKKYSW